MADDEDGHVAAGLAEVKVADQLPAEVGLAQPGLQLALREIKPSYYKISLGSFH